jgi:hypothetical protein
MPNMADAVAAVQDAVACLGHPGEARPMAECTPDGVGHAVYLLQLHVQLEKEPRLQVKGPGAGRGPTVRSSVGEAVLAAILGSFLGFLALFLREIGWVFSGGMALVLIAFYLSRDRPASVGWLLLAGGAIPSLILGRNGFEAIVDPSIEVGLDTWVMLAFALFVAAAGGITLLTGSSPAARSNRVP